MIATQPAARSIEWRASRRATAPRGWQKAAAWLIVLAASSIACARAAEPDASIAATVDEQPIAVDEITARVERTLGGRSADAAALARLRAVALELAIDRGLILSHLAARGISASESDLAARFDELERRAAARSTTVDALLAEHGHTRDSFREELAWELTWNRHLAAEISDERRTACFNAHRRELDGTEIRASHILFALPADAPPAAWEQAEADALRVRAEIESGRLTFADAAASYSSAPSRGRGGDLGYFPRHGRMAEPFARAAFALAEGETSQPVRTPFGVHLIQATGERRGTKTLAQVRREVDARLADEIFRELAARLRESATIEYSHGFSRVAP